MARLFAAILIRSSSDTGSLSDIEVVDGLRLGMRTSLAVDQSTYLVESSRSQKARSSASVVNSGIGLSFFDIQDSFFATHDTC